MMIKGFLFICLLLAGVCGNPGKGESICQVQNEPLWTHFSASAADTPSWTRSKMSVSYNEFLVDITGTSLTNFLKTACTSQFATSVFRASSDGRIASAAIDVIDNALPFEAQQLRTSIKQAETHSKLPESTFLHRDAAVEFRRHANRIFFNELEKSYKEWIRLQGPSYIHGTCAQLFELWGVMEGQLKHDEAAERLLRLALEETKNVAPNLAVLLFRMGFRYYDEAWDVLATERSKVSDAAHVCSEMDSDLREPAGRGDCGGEHGAGEVTAGTANLIAQLAINLGKYSEGAFWLSYAGSHGDPQAAKLQPHFERWYTAYREAPRRSLHSSSARCVSDDIDEAPHCVLHNVSLSISVSRENGSPVLRNTQFVVHSDDGVVWDGWSQTNTTSLPFRLRPSIGQSDHTRLPFVYIRHADGFGDYPDRRSHNPSADATHERESAVCCEYVRGTTHVLGLSAYPQHFHVLHDSVMATYQNIVDLSPSEFGHVSLLFVNREVVDETNGTVSVDTGRYEPVLRFLTDAPFRAASEALHNTCPICFERVVVGPSNNLNVKRRDGGFRQLSSSLPMFREFILQRFAFWPPRILTRPRIIFSDRQGQKRDIRNFQTLVSTARSLPGVDVTVAAFETMSIREQIALMQSGSILVGVQGTNLLNGAFLHTGGVVVPIVPHGCRTVAYHQLWQNLGRFGPGYFIDLEVSPQYINYGNKHLLHAEEIVKHPHVWWDRDWRQTANVLSLVDIEVPLSQFRTTLCRALQTGINGKLCDHTCSIAACGAEETP
eukprot:Rmarinus@m.5986